MKCRLIADPQGFRCRNCGRAYPPHGGRLEECPAPQPVGVEFVRDRGEIAPLNEAELPCIYRAGPPQAVQCKPCENRGQTLLVFACGEHGACTLQASAKRRKGGLRYQSCQGCEQRADF